MSLKISIFVCAAALLSACGGSGNGGVTTTPTPSGGGAGGSDVFVFQNKIDFEELQDRTTFVITPAADVPGSAEYEGFVQIFADNDAIPGLIGTEAVGIANFSIDLANGGSVSGSAGDFQDAAGDYTGTLDIANGAVGPDTVSPSSTIATAEIDGVLTRETGEVITIDGEIEGRFFGAGGEMLVGGTDNATGTVDGTAGDIQIAIHGELQ